MSNKNPPFGDDETADIEYLRHKAFHEGWPKTVEEAMEGNGYGPLHSPEGNLTMAGLLRVKAAVTRDATEAAYLNDCADNYEQDAKNRESNPSGLEYTLEQHRKIMALLNEWP